MKNLLNQKLSLLVFGFLILTACGDDDDAVKTKGEFVLGNETTKIARGYFIYDTTPNSDAEENDYYRNQIIFVGKGLTIEGSADMMATIGEGDMLELYVNNAGQELQTGTYTWQAEENEQPFDLWLGFLTQNVNTADEVSYRLEEGVVVVMKSGSSYRITFTGTAYLETDGDTKQGAGLPPLVVTAQFEGKLGQVAFDF